LVTAHPMIDHAAIAAHAPLFIDLRGVTRGHYAANLVRLKPAPAGRPPRPVCDRRPLTAPAAEIPPNSWPAFALHR
jgi:hypothetical protein